MALERRKVDRVIGAARQKGTRPELNCDWGGGPEISMREKATKLGGLGAKAEERMAVGKKTANQGDSKHEKLIRGVQCLIHEVF